MQVLDLFASMASCYIFCMAYAQVLALTVPPGATAGDLVRFVTPAGAIVAEVPHGVSEGQPFFVRLQPVV
jgi:hypothetical protein